MCGNGAGLRSTASNGTGVTCGFTVSASQEHLGDARRRALLGRTAMWRMSPTRCS
jgi:hypothetical protein